MRAKEVVDKYLRRRWYVRRCFIEGLINKSALARKIASENNLGFQAVLMAIRRAKLGRDNLDEKIKNILKKSRFFVRTGVGIAIGKENLDEVLEIMKEAYQNGEEFHLLKEDNLWVVIAPMSYINKLQKFGFKTHKDVVELVIRSPPEIEETPGVLSEILNYFRSERINIIEFMSCWIDTILIVSKEQTRPAISIIEKLIRSEFS